MEILAVISLLVVVLFVIRFFFSCRKRKVDAKTMFTFLKGDTWAINPKTIDNCVFLYERAYGKDKAEEIRIELEALPKSEKPPILSL